MALPRECVGAILAGGHSRRMGYPKAGLVNRQGVRLIDHVLATLGQIGLGSLVVSTAEPTGLPGLEFPLLADLHPGAGPLAGLEAVLSSGHASWYLLVAVDMPALEPELLTQLIEQAESPRQAIVPRVAGRAQPLHAVYHQSCLPEIKAALIEGQLGLVRCLSRFQVHWIDLEPSSSFSNLNTPGEADRLGWSPPE